MINFTKEYRNLYQNYLYYDREKIERIFLIFEGKGGSQTINREIIPTRTKIQDFLVLNSEMERALKFVNTQLINLGQQTQQVASYLFYFSQYGGSKTQFLNLVQDEINQKLPKVITIFIDDLTHLTPGYIFEQIIAQLLLKVGIISEFNNSKKYERFFEDLYPAVSEINVAMRQSSNLRKAEGLIENLRTSNPMRKQTLDQLNELLHSTILVDNLGILKKIRKLMQICSENELIFLFLFDEVDVWLDDYSPELRFSSEFLKIAKLMKNLLEFPDHNIKLFFLFACTDRVNRLFQEQQTQFSIRSPTASRLIRLYNNAEKISESGAYGDSIDFAFLKLSVLHNVSQGDSIKVDEDFYNRAIGPLQKKYNDIPRRNCNSIIIRLLKCYRNLYYSLRDGLNNWKNYTEKYGNLIQQHMDSILKRLNIKFVRRDILIDPRREHSSDKIDGYFINYTYKGLEKKIHAEIKVTSKFKEDKSRQVLQWLQLHPDESFIFLVFSPTPKENIKEKINLYTEKFDYDLKILENLYLIHIDDPYVFCAINGITKVLSDPLALGKFLDSYSFWFDFFGDFTEQYQEIQQQIGFIAAPPKPPRPEVEREGEIGEEQEEPEVIELTTEQMSCLQLLTHMYRENEFTKSGRKGKSSIEKIIEDKSMGITNMERLYKTMKEVDIITKITDRQIEFSIREKDEILNLGLEDFIAEIKNRFTSKPKSAIFNF